MATSDILSAEATTRVPFKTTGIGVRRTTRPLRHDVSIGQRWTINDRIAGGTRNTTAVPREGIGVGAGNIMGVPVDSTGIGLRSTTAIRRQDVGTEWRNIIPLPDDYSIRLRSKKVRLDIDSSFNQNIKETPIELKHGIRTISCILYNPEGDGNCFFRAVSVCKVRSELQHLALRLYTTMYMMKGLTHQQSMKEAVKLCGPVSYDVMAAAAEMLHKNIYMYKKQERVWVKFPGGATAAETSDCENIYIAADIVQGVTLYHVYAILFDSDECIDMKNVENVTEYTSQSCKIQFTTLDKSLQKQFAQCMFGSILNEQKKIFHEAENINNFSLENYVPIDFYNPFVYYLQQQNLRRLNEITQLIVIKTQEQDCEVYQKLCDLSNRMHVFFLEMKNTRCALETYIAFVRGNHILNANDMDDFAKFAQNIGMARLFMD